MTVAEKDRESAEKFWREFLANRQLELRLRRETEELIFDALISKEPTWQPIETVPKDGTEVLLAHGNSLWIDEWISEARESEGGYWLMCDQWSTSEIPTHWMSLPALPIEVSTL